MQRGYDDPTHPASFGGVDALHRAIGKKVPKKEIQEWLSGVDAYTLHKPVRRTFPTNRVMVYAIDQQWQCDLVDMINLKHYNQGYCYILTCIDILSKYAWAIPLKQKRGVDIKEAFTQIFQERVPTVLQSDAGTEFKNSVFQTFLKDHHVRFFTTFNTVKASVVERFNRTLRTKMWKYFTRQNTQNYVKVLPQLIQSYNHTHHSSIKMAPAEVNASNEADVWHNLYGEEPKKGTPCKLSPGDIVRISRQKMTFEKGYSSNWTEELFEIVQCVPKHHAVYRIRDLLKEPILGTFYSQELQKVKMKQDFPLEKVLKKRTRRNQVEYLVKYRGYADKFNEWIPATDLTQL